uniref:Uncharacterized protein n=1 Tax=Strigamia maritima TaxID=126957 RepID=T1J011_STRMM
MASKIYKHVYMLNKWNSFYKSHWVALLMQEDEDMSWKIGLKSAMETKYFGKNVVVGSSAVLN